MCLQPSQQIKIPAHHDGDMRHRLTESELQAVKALKTACDEQGIYYKHIFDLAKYVLVTHSMADDSNPKAAKIRLKAAVKDGEDWYQGHGFSSGIL